MNKIILMVSKEHANQLNEGYIGKGRVWRL